jgi:hypothetical protein
MTVSAVVVRKTQLLFLLSQRRATCPLSRLRGRAGVGVLSAMEFAEAAPTRLALLGTLPRKRERVEFTVL